jgi:hypothetical protein
LDRQRGEIRGEFFYARNAADSSLELGDLAAVEEALPSLRQLLDAVAEPGMMAKALRWLEIMLLRYRGELAEAIEGLRSLQTSARASGNLQGLASVNGELASICILEEIGEEEKLEAILQELLDLDERGMGTAVLAQCLLSVRRARQGEPEVARYLLAAAHEKVAEQGEFVRWEPYLSLTEASLAQAEGHWPEALAAFEATAGTLDCRNLRWYRARVLIYWAGAHLARGEPRDRDRARALLQEARSEFEEMGAPFYVARAEEQLHALAGELSQ